MKKNKARIIASKQKNWIDESTGRVYVKGVFSGFGIKQPNTNIVHLSTNAQGQPLDGARASITVSDIKL